MTHTQSEALYAIVVFVPPLALMGLTWVLYYAGLFVSRIINRKKK